MQKSGDSWIIRNLKRKKQFNPFNSGFDFQIVRQEIINNLQKVSNAEQKDVLTALSTNYFNAYFKAYYHFTRRAIKNSSISVDELIEYLISTVNRDFYLINQRLKAYTLEQEAIYFDDHWKYSLPVELVGERREVNPVSMLETAIDSLNVALDYLRYFRDKDFNLKEKDILNLDKDEFDPIKAVSKISVFSNLYRVIKESYEVAIWEGGYITINHAEQKIFIRFKDESYPIFLQIGLIRLQQNSFVFAMSARKLIQNNDEVQKEWFKYIEKFITPRNIESARLKDGVIKYTLSKGKNKKSLIDAFSFFSSMEAYYGFIKDWNLPKFTDLSLDKLLILFFKIKQLISEVVEIRIEDNALNNISDLKKFSYRIECNKLKKYLAATTRFTSKQINEFLSLLEHRKDRYDLWKRPFIKQNDDYLFPILIFYAPQILFLVDEWLEEGGFLLDERGGFFEDYIKSTLTEEISKKNFFFNIVSRKVFSVENSNSEEIDLILITKNSILIGEVKCIKLAMDSRSRHDALSKLREGAVQVIRKTKYLLDNREAFISDIGNIEGKEIIKAVITNYPTFSGLVLDGIPIIDFFLLQSYIQGEFIQRAKVLTEFGKISISKDSEAIKFYYNEDEFSSNLKSFLDSPPAIQTLISSLTIKDFKVTWNFNSETYEIFSQIVEPILSIEL